MSNKPLAEKSEMPPPWLDELAQNGLVPYIATSKHLLSSFNLNPFGIELQSFVMEDDASRAFLEAYLLSNALSFKTPEYKMQNWVFVDCVLLQQSIVGFMKKKEDIPPDLLKHFENDPCVDLSALTHIPLSGQIDAEAADDSLVNYSLFSLGREAGGIKNLGLFTKLLSLEAHRAQGKEYRIIAQYDSPSLKVHGRISSSMEIEQPMVPLHPGKDMTLVLKMNVGYDAHAIQTLPTSITPSFWLNAHDIETKKTMQDGIQNGKSYIIAPPFSVTRSDGVFLPIVERLSTCNL